MSKTPLANGAKAFSAMALVHFANPTSKWLSSEHGLDVTPEDIMSALAIPVQRVATTPDTRGMTSGAKKGRGRVPNETDNRECSYTPTRGKGKDIKCTKNVLKDTNYCSMHIWHKSSIADPQTKEYARINKPQKFEEKWPNESIDSPGSSQSIPMPNAQSHNVVDQVKSNAIEAAPVKEGIFQGLIITGNEIVSYRASGQNGGNPFIVAIQLSSGLYREPTASELSSTRFKRNKMTQDDNDLLNNLLSKIQSQPGTSSVQVVPSTSSVPMMPSPSSVPMMPSIPTVPTQVSRVASAPPPRSAPSNATSNAEVPQVASAPPPRVAISSVQVPLVMPGVR